MNFKGLSLAEVNKKYSLKKSKSIIIIDAIFVVYICFLVAYLIFSVVFIKAQVIGFSMQPTYNINLQEGDDAEKSIYQDVAYANRFNKGTNNDIVLVQTTTDVVIKRIIATQGQYLTLKYNDQDGFYYFYLKKDKNLQQEIIQENYILSRAHMNIEYYLKFRQSNEDIIYFDDYLQETTILIPQNQVFVLGDNRLVSVDSSEYGPISSSSILGRIEISYAYNENIFVYFWNKICSIF